MRALVKPKGPSAAVLEAEAKGIAARGSGYKGILSAATEPAAKAITAIANAEAQKEVARQYAEAQKEVARQATHQAAVRANPQILHELDSPIITISGKMGTKRNPQDFNASLSVLGIFALGKAVEDIYADSVALQNGKLPTNLSVAFDANRTPRTEVKGSYYALPTAGGPPSTGQGLVDASGRGASGRTRADWMAMFDRSKGWFGEWTNLSYFIISEAKRDGFTIP